MIRLQEGLRFFDEHDWRSAARAFEKAISQDPRNPAPRFFLSLSHFAQGEIEKSKSALDQGLELDSDNVLGHNILALHALHQNDRTTAVKILNQFGLIEHPRTQSFLLLEIERTLLEVP